MSTRCSLCPSSRRSKRQQLHSARLGRTYSTSSHLFLVLFKRLLEILRLRTVSKADAKARRRRLLTVSIVLRTPSPSTVTALKSNKNNPWNQRMIQDDLLGLLLAHQDTHLSTLGIFQDANVTDTAFVPRLRASALFEQSFTKDMQLGTLRVELDLAMV